MEPLFLNFNAQPLVTLVCGELEQTWPVQLSIAGFLLLALWVAVHAWRAGADRFATYIAGLLFGYSIEWLNVQAGGYCYQYGPLYLPGAVPLYVSCGWGMIFYCAYYTSIKLTRDWRLVALLSGLLALALDLLLDPGTVALGLWQWQPPSQPESVWPWYSVPWSNFAGWFLLILSLALAQYLLQERKLQAGWTPHWGALLWGKLKVMAAAYLGFAILYALYALLAGMFESHGGQTLIHTLLFTAAAAPVLLAFPRFNSGAPLEWTCLLVPSYLLLCAALYLLQVMGQQNYQPLIFIFPFYALAVMTAYYRPYRKIASR